MKKSSSYSAWPGAGAAVPHGWAVAPPHSTASASAGSAQ